jgi:hypothetical protein
VGVFGEPETLDPFDPLASDLTYALARPVYRSLYRFDPSGVPVPDLVETLDVSGDVATIRLADAVWSDGSPITSADVEASIRRARAPSGFAAIQSVQLRGPRRLVLAGRVQQWEETLARLSFVLPRAGKRVFSGPFTIASRVDGLQIVFEPNPRSEGAPHLDRVIVQYTEGVEMMIALLARGDVDVAWLPSSVNLDQRLDELELTHQAALGWERIVLDLSGSDLTRGERRQLAATLDRGSMQRGFVRTDGRVADSLIPAPGAGGASGPYEPIFTGRGKGKGTSLQLSSPSGDELLELLQRITQVQLDSNGFDVELVNVDARRFYGEWQLEDPIDAALRRLAGAPGVTAESGPRTLARLPLFQVETVLAWGTPIQGLQVNPTFEGPLWNAHEWFLPEGEA